MHLIGCSMHKTKWDMRYISLAQHVSLWSKDPSTKCGAVIVDKHNRVVSIGYNGFPQGIQDADDLLKDRNKKLAMTIHAERNALIFAKQDLHDCTLYTYPIQCCSECTAMMIQAGITRHVSTSHMPAKWQDSFLIAQSMMSEANIKFDRYTLKEQYESL